MAGENPLGYHEHVPADMEVSASVQQLGDRADVLARIGPVEMTAHQSRHYRNTVNIELDGDLEDSERGRLRVHLNDALIYDSTLAMVNYFTADEVEVALLTLAELWDNAGPTVEEFLSSRQQEVAQRVAAAKARLDEGL